MPGPAKSAFLVACVSVGGALTCSAVSFSKLSIKVWARSSEIKRLIIMAPSKEEWSADVVLIVPIGWPKRRTNSDRNHRRACGELQSVGGSLFGGQGMTARVRVLD